MESTRAYISEGTMILGYFVAVFSCSFWRNMCSLMMRWGSVSARSCYSWTLCWTSSFGNCLTTLTWLEYPKYMMVLFG